MCLLCSYAIALMRSYILTQCALMVSNILDKLTPVILSLICIMKLSYYEITLYSTLQLFVFVTVILLNTVVIKFSVFFKAREATQ